MHSQVQMELICLEAAFLSDLDGKVLRDFSIDLLSNADFGEFYVGRCILAATCNSAGIKLLLEGSLNNWPSCPPEVVLPMVRWSLKKSSHNWETLISASEKIAIDSSRPISERVWAAEIMSAGDSSRPARDIFVRESLGNPQSPLFQAALSILIQDRTAADYLPLLTAGFPQADLEAQQLITQLLLVALPEVIPNACKKELGDFIKLSSKSDDPAVKAATATPIS